MADIMIPSGAKSVSIEAVKIRADGSKEDLGVLFYWHKNPLVNAWWHIKRAFRDLFKCR